MNLGGDWTLEEDAHVIQSVREWPKAVPISWQRVGEPLNRPGGNVRQRYMQKLSKMQWAPEQISNADYAGKATI